MTMPPTSIFPFIYRGVMILLMVAMLGEVEAAQEAWCDVLVEIRWGSMRSIGQRP